MPATLTKEQNRRACEAVNELITLKGSASEVGRLIKRSQGWVSRFAAGIGGTSYATVMLICKELGRNVSEVLGEGPSITTWGGLPGFDKALEDAKASLGNIYGDPIWAQIGRLSMPPHPPKVEPWMLMQLAPFVAALLTNSVPLTPTPIRRGSSRRLKIPRRG